MFFFGSQALTPDQASNYQTGFYFGVGVGQTTTTVSDKVKFFSDPDNQLIANFGNVGVSGAHTQIAAQVGYTGNLINHYQWGILAQYTGLGGNYTNSLTDNSYNTQNNYAVSGVASILGMFYVPMTKNLQASIGAGVSLLSMKMSTLATTDETGSKLQGYTGAASSSTVTDTKSIGYTAPTLQLAIRYNLASNWFINFSYTSLIASGKKVTLKTKSAGGDFNAEFSVLNQSKTQLTSGTFLMTSNKSF